MKEIFGDKGLLRQLLPEFEFRNEQLVMADFILERLCNNDISFIEAGTGTGKTLAYLIPTLIYAAENEKKVILSTETKALQKQLMDKELPVIEKILEMFNNYKIKYSLCLGAWNYPCTKRFEMLARKGTFSKKEMKAVEKIEKLFLENTVFTFFDAGVTASLWSEMNRESDACNSFRCANASKCVYMRARREWNDSNLLIMNHYLYFTNLASGKTFLPQCEIVIFDEAHSVEMIASKQLGFSISKKEILEVVSQFTHSAKRNLINILDDDELKKKINEAVPGVINEIDQYFNRLGGVFNISAQYTRLKEPNAYGNDLLKSMRSLSLILNEIDGKDIDDHRMFELDIARGHLFLINENLNTFINQIHENYVYWLDREGTALLDDLRINTQPVDVADIVGPDFMTYDSCIFLSATIAIDKDFTFIANHLGVHDHLSLALGSPFDYKSQAVVFADKSPVDPGDSGYIMKAADRSEEIIRMLNGNCLMLFTSYKMLKELKQVMRDRLDMVIYSQDEMSPAAALESFMNSENSILMGTHSFWQGIDLPGDLLRGVIMMRLPFSVPDSPVMEAKIEAIVNSGGNPFYSLQVPEAVLRFKQGFGRLIRRKTDKGVVAILDSRITTKNYGRFFLNSIPECGVVYTIEDLIKQYGKLLEHN